MTCAARAHHPDGQDPRGRVVHCPSSPAFDPRGASAVSSSRRGRCPDPHGRDDRGGSRDRLVRRAGRAHGAAARSLEVAQHPDHEDCPLELRGQIAPVAVALPIDQASQPVGLPAASPAEEGRPASSSTARSCPAVSPSSSSTRPSGSSAANGATRPDCRVGARQVVRTRRPARGQCPRTARTGRSAPRAPRSDARPGRPAPSP